MFARPACDWVPAATRVIAENATELRRIAGPVLTTQAVNIPTRLDIILAALPNTADDVIGHAAVAAIARPAGAGNDRPH